MDFQTRKQYFNRCDPAEPLWPTDERYAHLDEGRGGRWADDLSRDLSMAREARLVTALPGSGLSTELRRVAARLDDAGFRALVVDATQILDSTDIVEVADVILAMVGKADEAVGDPEKPISLSTFLTSETPLREHSARSLASAVRNNVRLRNEFRKEAAYEERRFVAEGLRHLAALGLRSGAPRGLAILIDGLETFRGLTTNYAETLASYERAFLRELPYLRFPLPVVLSAPMIVLPTSGTLRVDILPAVDVSSSPDCLRDLVRRRLPESVLLRLLGGDTVRLENLVTASAGIPRRLVQMLREVVAFGTAPLSEHDFGRVLASAHGIKRGLSERNAALAQAVVERGELFVKKDPARLQRLLSEGVFVAYGGRDGSGGLRFALSPDFERADSRITV